MMRGAIKLASLLDLAARFGEMAFVGAHQNSAFGILRRYDLRLGRFEQFAGLGVAASLGKRPREIGRMSTF